MEGNSFNVSFGVGDEVWLSADDGFASHTFEITAITETGLIRTNNGNYGQAEFQQLLESADRVAIINA